MLRYSLHSCLCKAKKNTENFQSNNYKLWNLFLITRLCRVSLLHLKMSHIWKNRLHQPTALSKSTHGTLEWYEVANNTESHASHAVPLQRNSYYLQAHVVCQSFATGNTSDCLKVPLA